MSCASRPVSPPDTHVDLIFLDVDGVLNRTVFRPASDPGSESLLDSTCLGRLRTLLRAWPRAAVVVSSTWRLDAADMERLKAALPAQRVLSHTPCLGALHPTYPVGRVHSTR